MGRSDAAPLSAVDNTPRPFGFVVGPHLWKQFLFPASATVASADRDGDGWQMRTPTEPQPKYAFLGVRACELAAIKVQDSVFLDGPYVDPIYAARRGHALIIAVNRTQSGREFDNLVVWANGQLVQQLASQIEPTGSQHVLPHLGQQPMARDFVSWDLVARQNLQGCISS